MKSTICSLLSSLFIWVLLAGNWACRPHKQAEALPPFELSDTMLAHTEFAPVVEKEVEEELRLFGKVQADNNKLAQVYPAVGGNVMKINVELGDYVKQGQILASVRSSEVANFQRERLDAQAEVALAEKNLQVAKDLYEGKINAEKDVLSAGKELEKAKAELSRIHEVYNIYNLSKGSVYNITAPISGFIISKDINQNEQLRSDRTDGIFAIAEIDEVWVLANVNESDISKVALGYSADVQTLSYPNQVFIGKVDRIFNAIDPTTKAMKVLVKIPNPGFKLKPEMNATVTLRFNEGKRMLAIPSSSVIFDKSKSWVMVYTDPKHIETRQVEVYRQLNERSYISIGLNKGEKVVTKNNLLIYDALND